MANTCTYFKLRITNTPKLIQNVTIFIKNYIIRFHHKRIKKLRIIIPTRKICTSIKAKLIHTTKTAGPVLENVNFPLGKIR
jgi:hypothetical protein